MQNFWRAIQIALRFPWAIVGTITCSILIAILWGANIGALYPVLQVAFKSQSLQGWVDEEIESSRETIASKQTSLAELKAGSEPDTPAITRQQEILRHEIVLEKKSLATREFLRPIIHGRFMPRDPFQTVMYIVVGLMFATMLKGVFVFANSMLVAGIEQRVAFELRRQFFHQTLRMDMGSFVEEKTSGLLSHFNTDINYVTAGVRSLLGNAIREPLKMLACFIGASIISWRLLLFSLLLTPIVAFLVRKLAKSIKRANRRVLEEINQLYGVLTETFNGIQTVQAYTLEQSERNKFYRVSKECYRKAMRIAFYNSLTKPITETMGVSMISLALLAGAYLTLNRETSIFGIPITDRPLDLPQLLVFYGMLIGTTEPARKLSEIFNSIQAGVAASDRLFPLMSQEPRIVSPENPTRLPHHHAAITFDSVSFSYDPGTPILKNINLLIKAGETIAIVGPNGCGKSTLIQLLGRFFDPTEGSVRFDDIDIRNVRLKDLRQRFGLVTQQAHLFDDTVFNNIADGMPNASQSDVVRAAKQARADRFITERLPNGYETMVGASGSRLSGGQRQRIALARAMIRNPEILILDEATSQIDLESEQLIQQALAEFLQDRTTIMITHRLATLSLADRILVMNAGQVEDLGTHDELIARCPLYQRLHAIQFQQSA